MKGLLGRKSLDLPWAWRSCFLVPVDYFADPSYSAAALGLQPSVVSASLAADTTSGARGHADGTGGVSGANGAGARGASGVDGSGYPLRCLNDCSGYGVCEYGISLQTPRTG
jgi:hypothetical protein